MRITTYFLIAFLVVLVTAGAYEQPAEREVLVNDTNLSTELKKGSIYTVNVRADSSPPDSPPPDPPGLILGWDKDNIASPEEAEAKRAKGHWVNCLIKGTDEEAGIAWPDPWKRTPKSASSPWGATKKELKDWFWHEATYDQDSNCDFTDATRTHTDHFQKALNALGLSHLPTTLGGDNVCYSIEHSDEHDMDEDGYPTPYDEQHYEVNGEKFGATGAWYRFGINIKGGAIHSLSHEAPAHTAHDNWARKPHINELPHLGKASDIMFAYWMRNNPTPQNLRFYFAASVDAAETNPLVARILKDGNGDVPGWPGKKFSEGSREFDMLLGSPVGMTLAYMLLQHKAELGVKHVTDVTVLRDSPGYDGHGEARAKVMMVWRIADVGRVEGEERGGRELEGRMFRTSGDGGFMRVHEFRVEAGMGAIKRSQ